MARVSGSGLRRTALVLSIVMTATLLLVWASRTEAAAPPGSPQRVTLDLAVSAHGGNARLRRLDSFAYRSSGLRWSLDGSVNANDLAQQTSSFRQSISYDAAVAGDAQRLRIDSVRNSGRGERALKEFIVARKGAVSGVDDNSGVARKFAMTSDRWAAVRREQRLLNPQLLVRAAQLRPALVSDGGTDTLNARPQRLLVISDPVAPITLWIDSATGLTSQLVTREHNYLRRDVEILVTFTSWMRAGGVQFPRELSMTVDGQPALEETRSAVVSPRVFPKSRFRLPAGVAPKFAPQLASRGARTSQWLLSFLHRGFPKEGPVVVTARKVSANTYLIQGHRNQSMVVVQGDGVSVLEGAINDHRSEAIIAWINRNFPGRQIRYVSASHHHADHSAGMRPYTALGAHAIVHANAAAFWTQVFGETNSTILPDRLDRNPQAVELEQVPNNGAITLADSARPLLAMHEESEHADSMIVMFVQGDGVIFVSGDGWSPGSPVNPTAQALAAEIDARNLDVKWLAGGHGGVLSFAQFQQLVGAP